MLKGWWKENDIISDLQYSYKKDSHETTLLFLVKNMATSIEAGHTCYVAFYDVAKVVDTMGNGYPGESLERGLYRLKVIIRN